MSKTIVLGELRNNELRNVSLEAISAARQLNPANEVIAVIINASVNSHAEEMIYYGADQAINLQISNGEVTAESVTQAMLKIIDSTKPNSIILGHTSLGKDVMPRLAARLQAGLISDVVKIEGEGKDAKFVRPIYSGRAFEKVSVKNDLVMLTIRSNNFSLPEKDESRSVDITTETIELKNLRLTIRDIIRKASSGVDLTEANIVVSGGRGVKGKEGFELLQKLADELGGAVGASRGACDADFCDYSLQIGQTGKVVTPDLYIACGISGAIQHIAGMSNSKVIVAINKDPEANIFSIADYGIVGDLFEVVPILIEEFSKAKVS